MEGGDALDVAVMEDARTWKGELRARLKGRIGERRDGAMYGAMDGMEDALDAAAMGRRLECREERARSAVLGCGRDDVLLNKKESGTKISFVGDLRLTKVLKNRI
jgi:hypothetical protein